MRDNNIEILMIMHHSDNTWGKNNITDIHLQRAEPILILSIEACYVTLILFNFEKLIA